MMKKIENKFTAMIICVFILAISSLGYPSTFEPMTWEESFERSEYVFVGDVVEINYIESQDDPRTLLKFNIVREIRGNLDRSEIEIPLSGGPVGDGSFIDIQGLNPFSLNNRYIVFYGPGEWLGSPLVGDHVYMLYSKGDEDYYIDMSGRCIEDVTMLSGFSIGGPITKEISYGRHLSVMHNDVTQEEMSLNASKCIASYEVEKRLSDAIGASYSANIELKPTGMLSDILVTDEPQKSNEEVDSFPISEEEESNPLPVDVDEVEE